jgi:DME family drug/metabolite transporter
MTRVQPALSVRRGLIYVCVAATAWGTGGAAAALLHGASGLRPVPVSFWRFVCGAILMAAMCRVLPTAGAPFPGRRRWGRLVRFGLGMAVSQAAYFASIAESGVAMATLITLGTSPLVVAAGARLLLGERLGRTGILSMAVALGGLVLLIGPGSLSGAGAGYALLSAVTYGGVTLLSRAYPEDPYGTALWSFVIGAVALLPVAVAQGLLPGRDLVASVALIGYLGAVPTALAYGLFFIGLSAVRATTASVISLIEPLGATAIGVLLFGEHLGPAALAGGAALLVAVTCLTIAERR